VALSLILRHRGGGCVLAGAGAAVGARQSHQGRAELGQGPVAGGHEKVIADDWQGPTLEKVFELSDAYRHKALTAITLFGRSPDSFFISHVNFRQKANMILLGTLFSIRCKSIALDSIRKTQKIPKTENSVQPNPMNVDQF
jgi:hypothetical protein